MSDTLMKAPEELTPQQKAAATRKRNAAKKKAAAKVKVQSVPQVPGATSAEPMDPPPTKLPEFKDYAMMAAIPGFQDKLALLFGTGLYPPVDRTIKMCAGSEVAWEWDRYVKARVESVMTELGFDKEQYAKALWNISPEEWPVDVGFIKEYLPWLVSAAAQANAEYQQRIGDQQRFERSLAHLASLASLTK